MVDNEEVARSSFELSRPGGSEELQSEELEKGQKIDAGTRIKVPDGAELWILSPNDNERKLYPGNSTTLCSASAEGECTTVHSGSVWFNVRKRLSFFYVHGPQNWIQAAVRSTKFTVTVNDRHMSFDVHEGEILVSKRVEVRVLEPSKRGESGVDYRLETLKFRRVAACQRIDIPLEDYYADIETFATYAEAERHFSNELDGCDAGDDPLRAADRDLTLGYLFLEDGQPARAVESFENAMQKHLSELPNVSPRIAENEEALGYATLQAGDPDRAYRHFQSALKIYQAIYPNDADPAFVIGDLNIGLSQAAAGKDEKAAESLRSARLRAERGAHVSDLYYSALVERKASEPLAPAQKWDAALEAAGRYRLLAKVAEAQGDVAASRESTARAEEFSRIAEDVDLSRVNSIEPDQTDHETRSTDIWAADGCSPLGDVTDRLLFFGTKRLTSASIGNDLPPVSISPDCDLPPPVSTPPNWRLCSAFICEEPGPPRFDEPWEEPFDQPTELIPPQRTIVDEGTFTIGGPEAPVQGP